MRSCPGRRSQRPKLGGGLSRGQPPQTERFSFSASDVPFRRLFHCFNPLGTSSHTQILQASPSSSKNQVHHSPGLSEVHHPKAAPGLFSQHLDHPQISSWAVRLLGCMELLAVASWQILVCGPQKESKGLWDGVKCGLTRTPALPSSPCFFVFPTFSAPRASLRILLVQKEGCNPTTQAIEDMSRSPVLCL